MFAIESRQNPAVKRARKLNQKKYRQQDKVFLMEGPRALREVMRTDYPVETLYYSPGIRDPHDMILVEFLCRKANQTFFVHDSIMEYISPARSSQKIMAVLPQKDFAPDKIVNKSSCFLAINQAQNPGNLGTIIRSAKAFGCGGIFLVGASVEWYNPKVVRASAGNILDLPFYNFSNAKSFLDFCNYNQLRKIGFSPHCENRLSQLTPQGKTMLIMGGETEGLGEEIENNLDEIYRIPMAEKVESLNLSVGASIAMYELFKNT